MDSFCRQPMDEGTLIPVARAHWTGGNLGWSNMPTQSPQNPLLSPANGSSDTNFGYDFATKLLSISEEEEIATSTPRLQPRWPSFPLKAGEGRSGLSPDYRSRNESGDEVHRALQQRDEVYWRAPCKDEGQRSLRHDEGQRAPAPRHDEGQRSLRYDEGQRITRQDEVQHAPRQVQHAPRPGEVYWRAPRHDEVQRAPRHDEVFAPHCDEVYSGFHAEVVRTSPPSTQPRVLSPLTSDDQDKVSDDSKESNPRFKTEICRNFKEKGSCLYGSECQFAHGPEDMRETKKQRKYKTKHCQKYWIAGFCAYGARCNFVHGQNGQEKNGGHQESGAETSGESLEWRGSQSFSPGGKQLRIPPLDELIRPKCGSGRLAAFEANNTLVWVDTWTGRIV